MRQDAGLKNDTSVAKAMKDNRRPRSGNKKSVAKIGMTISMGALIVTGLMKGQGAKTLHIWSGIGLMGFSLWHHQLYRPQAGTKK